MHVRKWIIALTAGIGFAAYLSAQQPQPGPAADPRLNQLLARWEQEMASLHTMAANVTCTRKDPVFSTTKVSAGSVKFMRPDLARLELRSREQPDQFERYICTGSHVYNFRPSEQRIDIIQLPAKQAGQLPDDGPLPFFFGMKAESAKRRYHFQIVKEDVTYTYVEVKPRFERDSADFVAAMLSVHRKTAMPRQIILREPNNTEVTWDIPLEQLQRNIQIPREEFERPQLPRGWQWGKPTTLTSAPAGAGKQRVIRPSN